MPLMPDHSPFIVPTVSCPIVGMLATPESPLILLMDADLPIGRLTASAVAGSPFVVAGERCDGLLERGHFLLSA